MINLDVWNMEYSLLNISLQVLELYSNIWWIFHDTAILDFTPHSEKSFLNSNKFFLNQTNFCIAMGSKKHFCVSNEFFVWRPFFEWNICLVCFKKIISLNSKNYFLNLINLFFEFQKIIILNTENLFFEFQKIIF